MVIELDVNLSIVRNRSIKFFKTIFSGKVERSRGPTGQRLDRALESRVTTRGDLPIYWPSHDNVTISTRHFDIAIFSCWLCMYTHTNACVCMYVYKKPRELCYPTESLIGW